MDRTDMKLLQLRVSNEWKLELLLTSINISWLTHHSDKSEIQKIINTSLFIHHIVTHKYSNTSYDCAN